MSMNDDDLIRDLGALKGAEASEDMVARVMADAAFAAARRAAPVPSEMLMARIARDARDVARARRRAEWATWGGLVAACAVGLAVGLTDPGGLIAGGDVAAWDLDDLGGGYEFQMTGAEG